MIKRHFRRIIKRGLAGVVFPVFSDQLRGMRLKVDPLLPMGLLWNNVEEAVHNAYDLFVKPGNVIFDIGANVGLHSYYISRRFKDVSVFSFEPLPENAAYMREMIRLNHLTNITVIEMGIGAKSGSCFFDRSLNNHQGHITEKPSELKISVTSLDDFVSASRIFPDFIKIDVEGEEGEVLRGFKNMISACAPIVVIEIHGSRQCKFAVDFFGPLDYCLVRLQDLMNGKYPFIKINIENPDLSFLHGGYGQIAALPNRQVELVENLNL